MMARESLFPPLYASLMEYPVDLYIGMVILDHAMSESDAEAARPNVVEQAFDELVAQSR